eukprot:CAMPEP_0181307618 /NCGR_PEP_ID=MMETSP1101-20121128/10987_1 /TAXON_ID=46948 /ORGANISM="Rhodomonas abbreviata, Strain Caron Lab Isolate" /LENGTH=138 /DNA_ID=CAMNT_0023413869 /DNA_START=413 /DNA_END=829 /DNA_ORIENTATION=-
MRLEDCNRFMPSLAFTGAVSSVVSVSRSAVPTSSVKYSEGSPIASIRFLEESLRTNVVSLTTGGSIRFTDLPCVPRARALVVFFASPAAVASPPFSLGASLGPGAAGPDAGSFVGPKLLASLPFWEGLLLGTSFGDVS